MAKKAPPNEKKYAAWRKQLAEKGHGPVPPGEEVRSEDPADFKVPRFGRGGLL